MAAKKRRLAAKPRRAWAIVLDNGAIDAVSFKKDMGCLLPGERYARVMLTEITP